MLSIGKFAKAANISPRTVRFYESIGLIRASVRTENNYRYFDKTQLDEVVKIRDLQSLGFSLEEVREVLALGAANMTQSLGDKLVSVEQELSLLTCRRDRLKNLLFISQQVEAFKAISHQERRIYMDAVKNEVIEGIRSRQGCIQDAHLEYLKRDKILYESPEKQAFIEALKECLKYASDHDLKIGPSRGSSASSVTLYGFGLSGVDPTQFDLIPERLSSIPPSIHIDVEFERGQGFVDFCSRKSAALTWGSIQGFKMPLLDIINLVHEKIGGPINYQSIPDDDDMVLDPIRRGDIDRIFLFDYSPKALVMKYEGHLPEYVGTQKIKEYLLSQRIESFRDMVNIIAVWRPNHPQMLHRIAKYRDAKMNPHCYKFLSPELRVMLEKNFGLVIYHEDLIQIMAAYSGWDLGRCNRLRRDLQLGIENADLQQFKAEVPTEVFDLVVEEARWTFCKSHAMSFAQFTKQTLLLKSLHKQEYYAAIDAWEAKHGFVWDDIGIKMKGVSLLQH